MKSSKIKNQKKNHQPTTIQPTTTKALLYADYHPRKGKKSRSFEWNDLNLKKYRTARMFVHIFLKLCNFTKPTAETPSLLTFQVTTRFHEFGHALHGILANTQYPNLSGTSVKWDFVELPSQFLENYCYNQNF